MWWNLMLSLQKKEEEKYIYMNIHYYITKPQLFKIKLLNRIIVIREFLKQLIDCCLL
jgi:hypothetical protein